MEEEFFFSLLRISIAQILKASGFEKCKPSVLNVVTDLYIKHLELVIEKVKQFALARTNCASEAAASDVFQAFIAAGIVKLLRFGNVNENPDDDESNTRSSSAFLNWLRYSDQYSVSKTLCEVPSSLLHNLMEKRRIDTSSETDQERKKRRLKERQDFYNQLKQGEDVNQLEAMGGYVDDMDEDEIDSGDKLTWLTYLAEKDLKLGHNLKFVNSCIQDSLVPVHNNHKFHPQKKDGEHALSLFQDHILNNTKNDHILLQIHDSDVLPDGDTKSSVLPSAQLKDLLPYNVKYNLVLSDDSLAQYVSYAFAHPDEIQRRLNSLSNAENGTNDDSDLMKKQEENDASSESVEKKSEYETVKEGGAERSSANDDKKKELSSDDRPTNNEENLPETS